MEKSITCECGNIIDTREAPQIAICDKCNRRYGRQAPQLKLFDGAETFPNGFGTVIA